MNMYTLTELNQLAFNMGKLALKTENQPAANQRAILLNENILETVLHVNKHLSLASVSTKDDLPTEILQAYVKCNRLMAYIIQAYQKSEITREEFLHFEIELKLLMNRLEVACGMNNSNQ